MYYKDNLYHLCNWKKALVREKRRNNAFSKGVIMQKGVITRVQIKAFQKPLHFLSKRRNNDFPKKRYNAFPKRRINENKSVIKSFQKAVYRFPKRPYTPFLKGVITPFQTPKDISIYI